MKSDDCERGSTRAQSRRRRAPRLPPHERRSRLLAHALSVFARRGIGAARHAEVAAEAGVSVATTFVYFPTRTDLVDAVLTEVERLYVELAKRVHASQAPAPAVLLAHADAFARSVDEHPDHAMVWLDWSSLVGVEELWPRYRSLEERVVGIMARTLARGQREGTMSPAIVPSDGARIAIGAAYMIVQMKLSGRPEPEVARFLEALVRAVAGGLARNPQAA
jgi:TetR/AcrR family hemagglutinin/protease transcriptional regulator